MPPRSTPSLEPGNNLKIEAMQPMDAMAVATRKRVRRGDRREDQVGSQCDQRRDGNDDLWPGELQQLSVVDRVHYQPPFRRPWKSGEFKAG